MLRITQLHFAGVVAEIGSLGSTDSNTIRAAKILIAVPRIAESTDPLSATGVRWQIPSVLIETRHVCLAAHRSDARGIG